jgi:aryl-alcohol dehydrogenase-like predicted oxidoreductase
VGGNSITVNADMFVERAAGPMRIGLGCMALTGIYGAVGVEQARATLHQALDIGVRLFDTAALYAGGSNETLLGKVFGRRDDVFVATKFGLIEGRDGKLVRDSRPDTIRHSVEMSLARLRRERIDLLLQHRPDPETPDEVVAEVAAELIREGKIAAFGLSATPMDRIEIFRPTVVVRAVQNELSLSSTADPAQAAVASRAGVMFMAYAPLGRGILTGRSLARGFAPDDLRLAMPQYDPQNRETDVGVVDAVDAIARRHGTTRAAVALAWTLGTANSTVPLPGARSPGHVFELLKAASLVFTSQDVSELRVLQDRRRSFSS